MAATTITVSDATLKGDITGPTFTGKVDGSKFSGTVTYQESERPPIDPPIDPPPVEPPPSGSDWTPPSYLRTDTRTEAVPNVAKPGYLTPFTDPVFKTKIIRITGNPGDAIKNISGARWPDVARHHYSSDQAWNCDQTLIYLDNPGVFLDGETYEPKFMSNGIPSDSDVRWHATDPAWMVYAAGSKYGAWNPKTGEVRVIKNFGSAYSGCKFGPWEGSPSIDGDMVAISCSKGGEDIGFAYKISADKKYADIKASDVVDDTQDSVRISPLGNYLVWNSADTVTVTTLTGERVMRLPYNYISHYDVTVDEDGEEVIVGRVNSGSVGQGQSGLISKYRLRDGKRTGLSTLAWCYHTSARASHTHKWSVSASADEGGSNQPGEGEIILCNLDGSATYRLCHHHIPKSVDYVGQTQASHSPDGGRVIFASAWGGGGSVPRPVGCYICDFRT